LLKNLICYNFQKEFQCIKQIMPQPELIIVSVFIPLVSKIFGAAILDGVFSKFIDAGRYEFYGEKTGEIVIYTICIWISTTITAMFKNYEKCSELGAPSAMYRMMIGSVLLGLVYALLSSNVSTQFLKNLGLNNLADTHYLPVFYGLIMLPFFIIMYSILQPIVVARSCVRKGIFQPAMPHRLTSSPVYDGLSSQPFDKNDFKQKNIPLEKVLKKKTYKVCTEEIIKPHLHEDPKTVCARSNINEGKNNHSHLHIHTESGQTENVNLDKTDFTIQDIRNIDNKYPTDYKSRNSGCLFGYVLNGDKCDAPAMKDRCSYNYSGLTKYSNASFDNWIYNLRKRKCPGVPGKLDSNTLESGSSLRKNEFLLSDNKKYKLILQRNGNVVGLEEESQNVFWDTDTAGKGGYILAMQNDCNLVLYGSRGRIPWATHTASKKRGCKLVIEDDRNIILYDNNLNIMWSSKTKIQENNRVSASDPEEFTDMKFAKVNYNRNK